jgi:hypothetical protein
MLWLMTTQFDTISVLFRLPKNFSRLAALAFYMLLPGCSIMPPPPRVVSAPPPISPSVLALRQAEEKGYVEGFTAGKKVQARHDRAVAAALTAKAAAMAQPPTQIVQIVPPPPPSAPVQAPTPAPAPAAAKAPAPPPAAPPSPPARAPAPPITPAATPVPGQNSYNSSGPARPLGSAPPAF